MKYAFFRARRGEMAGRGGALIGEGRMNILVIDDDVSLRRSLRLALDTMGHRVFEAGDGSQAEAALGHGMFDVAFLDLRLGREQGLDLLPALLRLAPGL